VVQPSHWPGRPGPGTSTPSPTSKPAVSRIGSCAAFRAGLHRADRV